MLTAVVAVVEPNHGIGRLDGRLPWHPHRLHHDMAFLSMVTTMGYAIVGSSSFCITDHNKCGNTVVMGRRTFESLPPRMRPLPNRHNIVLTRNGPIDGVTTAESLDMAISMATSDVFVLGGKAVYEEAMRRKVPFLVTKIVPAQPELVHADIYLDTTLLQTDYQEVDITTDAYKELLRLKPELSDKGRLVNGVIEEGGFKYSFHYYH